MLQVHEGADHRVYPPPLPRQEDVANENVLVIGPCKVDLMCGLIRDGALEVTCLRGGARLEAESATLVIVRGASSAERIGAMVPAISRALVPTGRLLINDVSASEAASIRRTLIQAGYVTVRSYRTGVMAERPSFSLRGAA